MITSVTDFIKYFKSIRRRTLNFVQTIPPDQVEWRPNPDEFTCGDLIRHIAAAERMFVGVVTSGEWHYVGHEPAAAQSLPELIDYLEFNHGEAMGRLAQLADAGLQAKQPTLEGPVVSAWRFLMAMVEHEIHHRSQLAVYLTMMEAKTPQLYGLTIDEVVALSEKRSSYARKIL